MVGKIYLAKIYFTDLSECKIRPVLVIKELDDDCICMQLTTKYKDSNVIISNDDLEDGELKKDSLIVVPKNFTLNNSILFKYVGTLSMEKQQQVFKIFCSKI